MNVLKYHPPNTTIHPNFWESFYELKLNHIKLNNELVNITSFIISDSIGINNYLSLNKSSLTNESNSLISVNSFLLSVNTIEEFKTINKIDLINKIGLLIWNDIKSGNAINNPDLLLSHLIIIYGDLKSYKFNYWCCIPALIPNQPFSYLSTQPAKNLLGNEIVSDIYYQLSSKYKSLTNSLSSYPIVIYNNLSNELVKLSDGWIDRYSNDCYIVILDSNQLSNDTASWLIRNLLILLSYHQKSLNNQITNNTVRLLSLRGKLIQCLLTNVIKSTNYEPTIDQIDKDDESVVYEIELGDHNQFNDDLPKVVGWELNERNKPGPRLADLSHVLDTNLLMRQAVDLNIRLMRWRAWRDLDTEKIASTKCLLFGAGTLGCAVGRTLLSWGIRNITFFDNGIVSYSNPSRQCLFNYQDAVDKVSKSIAAAKRLKEIFPDVNSVGIVGTIPMPGHPINGVHDWENDLELIDKLVREHDVIFALTDSREARWLPTVLAASHNKLLINAALGFDSYLVMRHGHGVSIGSDNKPFIDPTNTRLGCYFCSDIVAASNSQRDRTLDQQCTVTRPGLSFIASALAVELMIAVLHEQHQKTAQSNLQSNSGVDREIDDELLIPHQIRGSLQGFSQINLMTPAYSHCTGCCLPIISNYLESPKDFVQLACQQSSILEEISGITSLLSEVSLDDCVESDDEF